MSTTENLSEDRLRTVIRNIADGVVVEEENGELQLFNRVAEEMLGYELRDPKPADFDTNYGIFLEDGVTRCPTDQLPPAQTIRAEDVERVDPVLRNPQTGRAIPIEARATPIRNEAGELAGGVVVAHETTNQRKIEAILREARDPLRRRVARRTAELRTSRANYRDLYDNAPDMFATVDVKTGRILQCNRTLLRMTGYTRGEIVGRDVLDLYALESVDQARHVLQQFVEIGEVENAELKLRRKDGGHMDVNLNVSALLDPDGAKQASRLSWRDITRHKMAIREREEQLRLLLDSTAEAIYGLDLHGRCTFYNPKCAKLLGYDESVDLTGKNMHALMHHSHADGTPYAEADCKIVQAFRQRQKVHVDDEVFWRADGTSFAAEYWSNPIVRGDDLVGSVVTFLDITSRRMAEEKVREQHALLTHVSRLSTLGEMAAGLAHEINQPLAAIAAYAAGTSLRLKSGTTTETQLVDIFDRIAADAQRAGEVIRRLRQFVRKRDTERAIVDVNRSVEEVRRFLLAEAIQRQITLELDLAVDLPKVCVDEIEFQQVLLNLIRNAFDAMADVHPTARTVTVSSNVGGGKTIEVAVHDNGPGISPHLGEQVFEAFYTSKTEGLGMGLAISRSIIETHGGRIWIGEAAEAGGAVHFSLPAVQGDAEND